MRKRGPQERGRATLSRRLAHLLAARLVLAAATLGVSLTLIGPGAEGDALARRGLYVTVAAAFLASAAFAWLHGRVHRLERFALVQLASDLAIVTAVVAFSGASASLLSFLYVPITVYAAMLFGRPGAYGSAVAASLAYAGVMVAAAQGWLGGGAASPPMPVELARWGTHTSALLLVALLASALSGERDRAGRALDERTRDLRQLQHLYERTVESLTSGLLTTDLEHCITSFNPEAERITGVPAARALGRRLEEVVPGAERLLEAPDAPARARLRARARLAFRSRDGRQRYIGLASSILREADGSPSGHVVIFQDVTPVVEMERELRRKERLAAAGRLAASMAHEIRNPLAAISGSIQMLQHEETQPGGSPETGRLMSIVLRETARLDALISDFLQYARPAPPRREPVALDALLEEAAKLFEPVRPENIRVVIDVAPGLGLEADPAQLRQLFWNLFRNAVEAMPEGGELRVSARPVEAQAPFGEGRSEGRRRAPVLEVVVSDTGVGIADEDLDRIFDPFYTTKREGTGLGLATVHRIVEANGGELSVESRLGEGTAFRMRFPLEKGS